MVSFPPSQPKKTGFVPSCSDSKPLRRVGPPTPAAFQRTLGNQAGQCFFLAFLFGREFISSSKFLNWRGGNSVFFCYTPAMMSTSIDTMLRCSAHQFLKNANSCTLTKKDRSNFDGFFDQSIFQFQQTTPFSWFVNLTPPESVKISRDLFLVGGFNPFDKYARQIHTTQVSTYQNCFLLYIPWKSSQPNKELFFSEDPWSKDSRSYRGASRLVDLDFLGIAICSRNLA